MDASTRRYVAVIIKEKNSAYVATVPDLGAMFTTGDTIEEAKANLPDAIATHLNGMETDGRTLPEPRSRKAVLADIEEPVVEDYVIEIDVTIESGPNPTRRSAFGR
ncbi:type II toxin-antitoxin system HicB family antitoxin [Afifella pfennigii]|uniref:type II toxin-antitoxin system HicB family antitoxin n=1 Tax=Afifella pfennigii TaxID=209897 RepID=UPI0009FBE0C6|nr:type II toxin-antitoxin system HicB family antitoxin [Afifella pfennigii]